MVGLSVAVKAVEMLRKLGANAGNLGMSRKRTVDIDGAVDCSDVHGNLRWQQHLLADTLAAAPTGKAR